MVIGNQAERRKRVSEEGAERDVDHVVVERAPTKLAAGCAPRLVAEIRSRRNALREVGFHHVGVKNRLQRVGRLLTAEH